MLSQSDSGKSTTYRLLDRYVIEQHDDQVHWIRIFSEEQKLMSGRGVYRDDVLMLLFPSDVSTIVNEAGLRTDLGFGELAEWDKTRYVVHMGNANQGYPVQEAFETGSGRELAREEVFELVQRIEEVFH